MLMAYPIGLMRMVYIAEMPLHQYLREILRHRSYFSLSHRQTQMPRSGPAMRLLWHTNIM